MYDFSPPKHNGITLHIRFGAPNTCPFPEHVVVCWGFVRWTMCRSVRKDQTDLLQPMRGQVDGTKCVFIIWHGIHLFIASKCLICPILYKKKRYRKWEKTHKKLEKSCFKCILEHQIRVHFQSTSWCAKAWCAVGCAGLCRKIRQTCCSLYVVRQMAWNVCLLFDMVCTHLLIQNA